MKRIEVIKGDETESIFSIIEDTSKKLPSKLAIRQTNGKTITYGELIRKSKLVAQNLRLQGMKVGDRALLLSRPGIDSVVWILGVMYAGGISVIADPGMGRKVFQERIKTAKPKWALIDDEVILFNRVPLALSVARKRVDIPDLPSIEGISIFHRGKHPLLNLVYKNYKTLLKDVDYKKRLPKAQYRALIVFTSGTTNTPKGVVHTQRSLISTLQILRKNIKKDNNSIFYTSLPYFLLIGVALGVEVVVQNKKLLPKKFLNYINRYNANILFGPPGELLPLIDYCKGNGQYLPRSIRHIYLGSAPVYRGFLKKMISIAPKTVSITCIYGMTEILPIAMVDGRLKASHRTTGDLLGKPMDNINIKLANDGELIVSGPHMCEKYLGKTGILSEVQTGDIVKIEKGNIVMMGRKKDMILKGDYNIYPGIFEPIIESIPGVKACAMIGIFNQDKFDEEIFLIVEPAKSADVDTSYISNQIKSGKYSIDTHAFPDHILFMELPRSGRQLKVDKLAIREIISGNAQQK